MEAMQKDASGDAFFEDLPGSWGEVEKMNEEEEKKQEEIVSGSGSQATPVVIFGVEIFSNPYGYLNLMQAAALDIGRNDYQRWKANNFNSILAGWMAIGMAPLAVAVGVEAAPTVATVYLGNPDKWNTLAGELTLGAAGYAGELPSTGGLKTYGSLTEKFGEGYKSIAATQGKHLPIQLGQKLNTMSPGSWNKIYEAGILNGAKVETHYFFNATTGQYVNPFIKSSGWGKAFRGATGD